ncbi:MAG: cytochrome c [Solirubrobacteraceae bacterium]
MLGVSLFVVFWVVLGLGLFSIAVRGGVVSARPARRPSVRRGNMASGIAFLLIYAVFGVALPLIFLTGNHAKANGQIGGNKLNAAQKSGRELFATHCGVCHTLVAANAAGKVGPDLDTLQPPSGLVLHTIENGCLQNAPASSAETCLGYGTMPAGIVQGKEAQQIAAFVGRVAGKE